MEEIIGPAATVSVERFLMLIHEIGKLLVQQLPGLPHLYPQALKVNVYSIMVSFQPVQIFAYLEHTQTV